MPLGTGLTKGPYTPTAGVSFSVSDPNVWGNPSTLVQIQNASGFTLSVASNGAPYTIQPQTATTIPTVGNGSPITITPSSGVANQVGTITTVWLLPDQTPPIPDGYLNNTVAAERVALVTSSLSFNVPLQPTDVSIYINLGLPGYVGGQFISLTFYSIVGAQSGIQYAYSTTGYTPTYPFAGSLGPFPVFGAIDTSVNISYTISSAGGSQNPTSTVVFSSIPLSVAITGTTNVAGTVAVSSIAATTNVAGTVAVSSIAGTTNVAGTVTSNVVGGSSAGVGVYQYGGATRSAVTAAANATTAILSAPAAGTAYRIHGVSIWGNGATSIAVAFGDSIAKFAELHMGSENQAFPNGLIWPYLVTAQNFTGVATAAGIFYDLITTPTIY
jgi:hypothetical protein